jgi:phosphomannomutase
MKEPIISISGIRGVFGESLIPENIVRFASAFAEYVDNKRVVLGRDGRLNGEIIEKIIESTLLFSGCEVINLGIVPTPTISLAVGALKAGGGIAVTASHNPQVWNGMKFINRRGIFLDAEENKVFLGFAGDKVGEYIPVEKVKQVEYYPEFSEYHINRVLKIRHINLNKVKKRKFKVVADCVNSSGSVIIPELLKRLGCKVYKLDCDSSGIFTRKPEPIPENLGRVCKEVKKRKADLGIVVDPDADRLVLITEKGKPFGEENTITAAVKYILSKTKESRRIAAVNLSTTRSVDDVVNELGGKLFKSPVGEINVIGKMKETGAVIGGEGSGGVILPEFHYGRDSLTGIAILLSALAEFGGRLSEFQKQLPEYFINKSKIELKSIDADSIFKFISGRYFQYPQNSEDGLRIDFENGWGNFRKSNTEPIIRIITEARTANESNVMHGKFVSEINAFLRSM